MLSFRSFGVRRQAKRDGALDVFCSEVAQLRYPKRRRRFALPAHSKLVLALALTALCFVLSGCRRDMQDQPKAIAYRESTFFKDGTGSRPPVAGTVPRGYLRADREFFFGKKSGYRTGNGSERVMDSGGPQSGAKPNAAAMWPY